MFSRHLLFLLRQLAKRPGLTIAIVLITAAGIAVNAAVFSVVYAVLLKPLPYPEAQQLLFISGISSRTAMKVISFENLLCRVTLRYLRLLLFKIGLRDLCALL